MSLGPIGFGNDDGLANDQLLYPLLVDGANTITNVAGSSYNTFDGGAGDDEYVNTLNATVDFFGATAGVSVNLGTGSATGGGGQDSWVANSAGRVIGSAFNDSLTGRNNASLRDELRGDTGNDTLTGLAGIDTLLGETGNDILRGGAGNDTLGGEDGLDLLVGGLGRDGMTGGAQKDVFDFNQVAETGKTATTRDKISDFKHLTDDIDLSTIDANGAAAGNIAFKFLAAKGAAFTGVQGQLHWFQINLAGTLNDKTIIEGDINGDKRADFQIELTGLKVLSAADFIL